MGPTQSGALIMGKNKSTREALALGQRLLQVSTGTEKAQGRKRIKKQPNNSRSWGAGIETEKKTKK